MCGSEPVRQFLTREQILNRMANGKPVKGVSDERRDMGELCDAYVKQVAEYVKLYVSNRQIFDWLRV